MHADCHAAQLAAVVYRLRPGEGHCKLHTSSMTCIQTKLCFSMVSNATREISRILKVAIVLYFSCCWATAFWSEGGGSQLLCLWAAGSISVLNRVNIGYQLIQGRLGKNQVQNLLTLCTSNQTTQQVTEVTNHCVHGNNTLFPTFEFFLQFIEYLYSSLRTVR